MSNQRLSDVYFLPLENYSSIKKYLDQAGLDKKIKRHSFVAIKVHFGEKGNKGFIAPERLKPIADYVKACSANPFITDANTIYRGQRTDAYHHLLTAHGHGFRLEKCGAPLIIADGLRGNSYIEVEINQRNFKKVKVARDIFESDFIIFLSHFKGHLVAGFGGAIKNAGMGCGARPGKYEMHASLIPVMGVERCTACGNCIPHCAGYALKLVSKKIHLDKDKCVGCGECILACPDKVFSLSWDRAPSDVQERMVEYAFGVLKDRPAFFINFVNFVTANCDCLPTKEGPLVDDVGVLTSYDPVALDQASIDLVNKKAGGDIFKKVHPGVDYNVQLGYAEKLGVGTRKYNLIGG